MSRKRKTGFATATYCRSYLVTLGILFGAMAVYVWYKGGANTATWPRWELAVALTFLCGGLGLIGFGLLGPSNKMERWAEVASKHWGSLVIMVLAYPMHMVLVRYYDD